MSTTGMGLGMWIFWIVIIISVAFIIKLILDGTESAKFHQSESPSEVLKKRYARGEIDKEEFDAKSKEINQ